MFLFLKRLYSYLEILVALILFSEKSRRGGFLQKFALCWEAGKCMFSVQAAQVFL